MPRFLPFRPFPLCSGTHAQTLLAGLPTFQKCPPSRTQLISLRDGDQLACEVSTPPEWQPHELTVITIHGLCGNHRSTYQVRLGRKLYQLGVRVVRVNLRGCGSGVGLARRPYHAGCSSDIMEVLQHFRAETPLSPMRAIGYSMGGNIILKLVGEMGQEAEEWLELAVAVCPPINLHTSSRLMAQPQNRLYQLCFMHWLQNEVRTRELAFPDLPRAQLFRTMTFREFDDYYTAPRVGFRSAMDYYTSSSSELLIPRIRIPTKIVFSQDDPIIDCNALDHLELKDYMQIYKTSRGGHVGFLGHPNYNGGVHWLDAHLINWTLAPTPHVPTPLGQEVPEMEELDDEAGDIEPVPTADGR